MHNKTIKGYGNSLPQLKEEDIEQSGVQTNTQGDMIFT